MADLNRVMLMGNLTRDPEVRHTGSGTAVADLRVALKRRYRTAQGEDKEEVCYVTVTAWGRQAETSGQYLKKGSPVFVEGHLKMDEWEKDGQKQSRLGVVAERIQFLSSPRRAEYGDTPAPGRGPAPRAPAAPAAGGEAANAAAPAAADEDHGDREDLPF